MTTENTKLLRELMAGHRVMALGVMVEETPYISLVPFALTADWGAFIIHASRLARHAGGLTPGAPFSAMLHAPDQPETDPLQILRVTFQGVVEVLAEGTAGFEDAKNRYLARFPGSAQTFLLGDFKLYGLHIRKGRLVAGFARTMNFFPQQLVELSQQ
jgi:hypothetical protein